MNFPTFYLVSPNSIRYQVPTLSCVFCMCLVFGCYFWRRIDLLNNIHHIHMLKLIHIEVFWVWIGSTPLTHLCIFPILLDHCTFVFNDTNLSEIFNIHEQETHHQTIHSDCFQYHVFVIFPLHAHHISFRIYFLINIISIIVHNSTYKLSSLDWETILWNTGLSNSKEFWLLLGVIKSPLQVTSLTETTGSLEKSHQIFDHLNHPQPCYLLCVLQTSNMKLAGIHHLECFHLVQYYLKYMDPLFPHNHGGF